MSDKGSKKVEDNMTGFDSVVPHSSGGTLHDFLDYLTQSGQVGAITAQGRHLWHPDTSGQLVRLPSECTEPVDPAVIQYLLRHRGTWVVSYLLAPDANHRANCFDYVCSKANYTIEDLHSNARRDIRRGLRNFNIRLCTWDELAEKGFAAEVDTARRHMYRLPKLERFKQMVHRKRDFPFFRNMGCLGWGQLSGVVSGD